MLDEQTPEMAVTYAQPFGQFAYARLIEGAFGDFTKGAGDCRRGTVPGGSPRGTFRPASQARAESSRRRCRRRRIILNILFARRPRGTDGPAKDPGRADGDEEAAVESGIARQARFAAGFAV
jgi:hypothetical protein